MRALKVMVVVMAVLIVLGTIGAGDRDRSAVGRAGCAGAHCRLAMSAVLDEPAGTRIAGMRRCATGWRCSFRAAGRTGWC